MDHRLVQVPVSLLLDLEVPASAKLVWIARRLHRAASPAELARQTDLSRHTVLRGLALLPALHRLSDGPKVKIPAQLLAAPGVGAQAKVLYGLQVLSAAARAEAAVRMAQQMGHSSSR